MDESLINNGSRENVFGKKGITLIALVITIIVLIILAGVSIATLLGDNGILDNAKKSVIVSELSKYKEELDLYKYSKKLEDDSFYAESLTAAQNSLFYNTKKDNREMSIRDVITSISNEYIDKIEIIKGELLLNTQDNNLIKLAKSLNIKVNPYIIIEGRLMSSEGNLLLVDENGKLTLPESVTKIAAGAFSNVEGLKTIIIPGTVKEIEKGAFMSNKTLENVIMMDGIEKIGGSAFKYCSNLKKVEMPDTVTSIGGDAFWFDTSLTDVKLSSKITNLSGWVFKGCTGLKSIVLPENINTIGKQCFENCSNLESINFPKSLKNIGTNAFNGATSLTTIDIDSENTTFSIENGVLIGREKGDIILILSSAVSGNTFVVPNGVKILNGSLLNSYTQITGVEIPESVTSLDAHFLNPMITSITIDSNNENYMTDGKGVYTKDGKGLVRYLASDTTIVLGEGLEYIQYYAFNGRSNITSISFPESLKELNEYALNGCNRLTQISLGKNLKKFDNRSLLNTGITRVSIDEENENFSVQNGAIYNKDGTKFISPITRVTTYSVPEGVKEIADYAFNSQTNMTSVILPSTLEKIGASFQNCTKLTRIEIPSNVTSISLTCFTDCGTKLTEIIVHKPEGSIGGAPWGSQYGDRAVKWDN